MTTGLVLASDGDGGDLGRLAAVGEPVVEAVQAVLGAQAICRTWSGWPAWRFVSVTPIRGWRR